MRGNISTARIVSVSLILFLFAGVLHLPTHVKAEDDKVVIEKVFYQDYSGRTDVYTNKGKKCLRIRNKKTGNVWEGTTNADGVISIGESASKEDLEAEEVSYCPDPDKLSAGSAALNGVVTIALETKKGQVKLTLPADIRTGDTISGTVNEYDARSNVVRPDTDNRIGDRLEGAVIDINGQQHQLRDQMLTFAVPATVAGGTVPVVLRDHAGRELARNQIQVNQRLPAFTPSQPGAERSNFPQPDNAPPTPSGDFQPQRIGQTGRDLSIPGKFDGNGKTTSVLIGNQPARFLAESFRGTFVRVPENAEAGLTMLTVQEVFSVPGRSTPQVVREQFKFNTVSVDLKADKLNLTPGEGTTLHITLSGLNDYEEPLALELENLSPQVVRLTGRDRDQNNHQRREAQPNGQFEMLRKTINPAGARNGVITLNEQLTGVRVGAFTIHATVRTVGQ